MSIIWFHIMVKLARMIKLFAHELDKSQIIEFHMNVALKKLNKYIKAKQYKIKYIKYIFQIKISSIHMERNDRTDM